jgi:hypothetical protein
LLGLDSTRPFLLVDTRGDTFFVIFPFRSLEKFQMAF